MNGIIVLDGPDGAGKTTLAKHLVENHGAKYIHLTYRWPRHMFEYHTSAIHRAGRLAKNNLVVIDRWWMSELCYANAYRGGSSWPLMSRMMQRVLLKYSGIYVYCLPVDTREHLRAYDDLKTQRKEMYKDILPVVMEYHKLWDRVKHWPNITRYDRFTQGGWLPEFTEKMFTIMATLQAGQPADAADHENHNLIGHVGLAKYLFIGDQTNQRKFGGTWWPFYEYKASSLYLTQLLDKLHFEEHEGAWCNARGEPEMARSLLDRFELIPICLGKDAFLHVTEKDARNWSKRNHPYAVLHPAYDRRFPIGIKGASLIEGLGSIIHGGGHGQLIYRDNTCYVCNEQIKREDNEYGDLKRTGVVA